MRHLARLLAALRGVALLLCTAVLLALLFLLQKLLPQQQKSLADHFRRLWATCTCILLGLRVRRVGSIPTVPALFAANHRSWADAPVLLATLGCTLLSKAEVGHYPLIGIGARAVGIAFVKRESLRSRARAQADLSELVVAGRSLGLFAEGTTTAWGQLRPLQPGAFRAAAELGALTPIAIAYSRPSDTWGDESLAAHFLRTMGRWRQHVTVIIGPVFTGHDAQDLRQQTEHWLRQQIAQLEPVTVAENRAASH